MKRFLHSKILNSRKKKILVKFLNWAILFSFWAILFSPRIYNSWKKKNYSYQEYIF
jgi:hypothetical protein